MMMMIMMMMMMMMIIILLNKCVYIFYSYKLFKIMQ